jgi:hypothetical protein
MENEPVTNLVKRVLTCKVDERIAKQKEMAINNWILIMSHRKYESIYILLLEVYVNYDLKKYKLVGYIGNVDDTFLMHSECKSDEYCTAEDVICEITPIVEYYSHRKKESTLCRLIEAETKLGNFDIVAELLLIGSEILFKMKKDD